MVAPLEEVKSLEPAPPPLPALCANEGREAFGKAVKEEEDDEVVPATAADGDADDVTDPPEVVVKAVVASCADDNPTLASSSPGILATRNARFLHHYRALRTWSKSLAHLSRIYQCTLINSTHFPSKSQSRPGFLTE